MTKEPTYYVCEGDTIAFDGKHYLMGESAAIEPDELESFIDSLVETEKVYMTYPFLFFIFGGTVKSELKKVWVTKDSKTHSFGRDLLTFGTRKESETE